MFDDKQQRDFSLRAAHRSFPDADKFESVIAIWQSVIGPRGINLEALDNIIESHPEVIKWFDFPNPHNYQLVVAEIDAIQNSNQVHPARVILLNEFLKYNIKEPPFSGTVAPEFVAKLKTCFARQARAMAPQASSALRELRRDIRKVTYDKSALLTALNHPLVGEDALEGFMNVLVNQEMYFYEIGAGESEEERASSQTFGNITSDFSAIVRWLATQDSLAGKKLIDLGCGGGGAIIPIGLLSDLEVVGIELDSNWVAHATNAQKHTRLRNVSVMEGDILTADLSSADIFYIYSPFKGNELIDQLVCRVEEQARTRPLGVLVSEYEPMCKRFLESDCFRLQETIGTLQVYNGL